MSITHNDTSKRPEPHPAIVALRRAQERQRELENFVRWEDELFSNPNISGNHKLEIRATKRAVQRAQTRDDAGRARINLSTIAEQIGVSTDTVSRGLKFLKETGVIADHDMKPEIQENGERWTRHYIALDDALLQKPREIAPPTSRNHGGQRYTCQKCGSDQVRIKRQVTIVCKCCRHESLLEETERDQEPENDSQDQAQNVDEQGRNLPPIIKPVTPPYGAEVLLGDPPDEPEINRDDLRTAAELLLALAGQADEHIEMSRRGEKKYYTVDRPLNINDLLDHLQGGKARGAACSYAADQTRGLGWDADDAERWELLRQSARQLAQAGYCAILEESPASRGGHLWIIYTDLVNASAARLAVYAIVPDLANLVEYWPGPVSAKKWNRVRLPGAKYVRPGVSAWCQLVSVATGERSHDGWSAATLLLANQTPAAIVPAICSDQVEYPATGGAEELLNTDDNQTEPESKMLAGKVDNTWYAKYNTTSEGKRLWFAWTSAQLATWYNERHSLEEIRPRERNGMALSPNVDERSASTAYRDTPTGERYTDFSAGARRSDGTHDTGDALELQTKISRVPKPEVMRQAARELLAEARQELESAARSGQPIPSWLTEIITDAGREHYARVASQAGYIDQVRPEMIRTQEAEAEGGVTGFLFVPVQERIPASNLPSSTDQLRESALVVSQSIEMQQLEAIKSYGERRGWLRLEVGGQEIIAAGRTAWLRFIWLSGDKERQRQVYHYISQSEGS